VRARIKLYVVVSSLLLFVRWMGFLEEVPKRELGHSATVRDHLLTSERAIAASIKSHIGFNLAEFIEREDVYATYALMQHKRSTNRPHPVEGYLFLMCEPEAMRKLNQIVNAHPSLERMLNRPSLTHLDDCPKSLPFTLEWAAIEYGLPVEAWGDPPIVAAIPLRHKALGTFVSDLGLPRRIATMPLPPFARDLTQIVIVDEQ